MGNKQKILISQQTPNNTAAYAALKEKYGVEIEFRPFYLIEPLSSREFRAQRVNIPDFTAITFSSRHAIDAFFKLCDELRIKVPETMKYFCTTEAVAMYLQKHIVFRTRKIFFGTGTADSLLAQIGAKHQQENFLMMRTPWARASAGELPHHHIRLFKGRVVLKAVHGARPQVYFGGGHQVRFTGPQGHRPCLL